MEEKFTLTSNYEEVSTVILSIKEYFAKNGVEKNLLNEIDICLTEALNNVIKHSYSGEQNHSIDVIVSKDSEYFEMKIVDTGKSRENLVIKDLNFDPEDIDNLPESGMGLYIIKQLMTEINYYSLDGKNFFILRKNICTK